MKMFRTMLVLALTLAIVPVASAASFSDVPTDHPNYYTIEYVKKEGIMNGYEDGTFRPGKVLNRAELLKVAMSAWAGDAAAEEDCFDDVSDDAWFAEAVCAAKVEGIVGGYEDGTFRPGNQVTVVGAAKILALSHGLETQGEGDYWYTPYLNVMDGRRALPATFEYVNQGVTRAELAEIMWRLNASASQLESVETADVAAMEGATCSASPEDLPETIDIQRVRETWLGWTNDARSAAGLPAYEYNDDLGRTAAVWSERAESLGYISHTRPGSSAYYDYGLIGRWFADLGVSFASGGGRSNYVENIGWEYYSCSDGDCTEELIAGIRKTFNFFMSEKGSAYAPHYDSIMNPTYNLLGLGIAVDETAYGGKFYLTVHYGTEIVSDPPPVCPV